MPPTPTTPTVEPYRIRDAIPLPQDTVTVTAHAHRSDSYTVHVVGGMRELLERLGEVLDGVSVAVLTDETVHELYGAQLLHGLQTADVSPIAKTVPASERSKSLGQAIAL